MPDDKATSDEQATLKPLPLYPHDLSEEDNAKAGLAHLTDEQVKAIHDLMTDTLKDNDHTAATVYLLIKLVGLYGVWVERILLKEIKESS